MRRLAKIVAIAFAVIVPAALAASGSNTVPGTWRKLPPAPFSVPQSAVSVWTGRQLIVFGRRPVTNPSAVVAESYDPTSNAWSRLSPPSAPRYTPGYRAVWTGTEMLVFGAFHSVAFNAGTGKWRELRDSVPGGITVWSGREAIGWGGGCCGDAFSDGVAYNPSTNRWRALARAPLAGSQDPIGAWTGRELVVFVGGFDPDGKPWPARLARAAAYNPTTGTWRRIAELPGLRGGAKAVWDGHEVLVVGASRVDAYDPATNRWRRLAPMPSALERAAVVWTGTKLLVWSGKGFAYDPKLDRWARLPSAPLRARFDPTAVWTGRSLIVWGGTTGRPPYRGFADGAAFTP